MRTTTERRDRLYPKKSPVVYFGPTKWVPTRYLHPIIKDKMVETFTLEWSPEEPKKLFWKD